MEQKKAINLMVLFAIVISISTYVYVKSIAKSFEAKQLPPETEMQRCLRETNSDGSDEDCEWCDFLLQDDCRQIDTIVLVWEGEPLFGVGLTDGTGWDFLNLYEMQQITKHSKPNI